MRVKEIKIFEYDELSEEAKEKARDGQRRFYADHGFADSVGMILDFWKERLKYFGFYDAEIYFSGFDNQGDGAVFVASINEVELIDRLFSCAKFSDFRYWKRQLILAKADFFDIDIKRTSTNYSHEHTAYIDVTTDHPGLYVRTKTANFVVTELNKLMEAAESLRVELCYAIYADLVREWEWINSDENLEDTIRANKYEFYEDGSIA